MRVACVGAGPAGLTAAYLLAKAGVPVEVFEADPRYVGGIARTVDYKGFKFDVGGHRFFSKSREVNALWREWLGDELLTRPRRSRIRYDGQLFNYPLDAGDVLRKLGPRRAALGALSYLKARARPKRAPRHYEEFMVNRFGRRLFETFFKTYTEKVWGMRTDEISADWAAQRVKELGLGRMIARAVLGRRAARGAASLIEEFLYPAEGPGMMWEEAARRVRALGGTIRMGERVDALALDRGAWTVRSGGEAHRFDHVISSAPLRAVMESLSPAPRSLASARRLRYRDFLIAVLILEGEPPFPDTWIYAHDPAVRVGRVQNYKAWSPRLIPRAGVCSLGLEYFCFKGDPVWALPDAEVLALAARELELLGLSSGARVLDGCVVRQPKAYPVYDLGYQREVDAIRAELRESYPGLHLVGRNGMHKYNNQDHSMVTAMLTVENILAGEQRRDPWAVNAEAEYHESGGGLRRAPRPLRSAEDDAAAESQRPRKGLDEQLVESGDGAQRGGR